jgi:hypothetical protein
VRKSAIRRGKKVSDRKAYKIAWASYHHTINRRRTRKGTKRKRGRR